MRRGLFQDYANQVCQMAVGWRISIADLPLLVEKQRGEVRMDLLSGDGSLNGEPASLAIYREVKAWLVDAVGRDEPASDAIRSFQIRIEFASEDTFDEPAVEGRQTMNATSPLVSESGAVEGTSQKRELWSRRGASRPWRSATSSRPERYPPCASYSQTAPSESVSSAVVTSIRPPSLTRGEPSADHIAGFRAACGVQCGPGWPRSRSHTAPRMRTPW